MQLAAYYFPNYHLDCRNEKRHGANWTEWELMKCARPRFEGHRQPKLPLWGFEDEADPMVMNKKINAAADSGIDAFVFDWYWYDGPYLERALDEGFLNAPDRSKIKFALMWANHDWMDRHPINFANSFNAPLVYPWTSTCKSISFVWEYIIQNYMTKPEYWYVDGKPYFSIYAVNRFIDQMGGAEKTAEVLAEFRTLAQKAGLPGIHINAVWYDNLAGQPFCVCDPERWTKELGFDSYTSYNSISTTPIWLKDDSLTVNFDQAVDEYSLLAKKALDTLSAPYFPVATAGWDSSPRCVQSETYRLGPYPYLPVMEPDAKAFRRQLEKLSALLAEKRPAEQILFINAWNEWTEGSYLEPDTVQEYAYLEEIKEFTGK